MTKQEKAIREFCGHHADWWPSTTQVQEMLALAQPEQEPVAWWNDTGTHIDLNVSGRGTPLYTTQPQIKVGCAECGVNGNHALYCVACAERYLKKKNT